MCELYKTLSLKNVAKRVGIAHSSVRRLLVEADVELRKPRAPGKMVTKEQLTELYIRRELSTTDIAKALNINQSTVLDKLLDCGIPTRSIKEGEALAYKHGKRRTRVQPLRLDRVKASGGYYLVRKPEHDRANANGYVREHLAVWEAAHGKLPKNHILHHKNGDCGDNRLSNLHAFSSNSLHIRFHAYANRRAFMRSCPKRLLSRYLKEWLKGQQ